MFINNIENSLDKIIEYLYKKDEKFFAIVDDIKIPTQRNPSDGFCLIVETIISQQLSNKASEAIFNRFLQSF